MYNGYYNKTTRRHILKTFLAAELNITHYRLRKRSRVFDAIDTDFDVLKVIILTRSRRLIELIEL